MSNVVPQNWTPEQLKLITDSVAKGATPDELKLFLYRCQTLGLNPLKPGVIHFIKYGTNPGAIVIGIEGFRSLAARTGKVAGVSRGVIKDDSGTLLGAWAEVDRADWKKPAREEVSLKEYSTGKGPWVKMPETMIKKVAECHALRMAFPDDLGGVYEFAEMDQAAPEEQDEKKSHVNVNTNTPLPKVAQTTSAGSAEKISNPTCPKCGGKTRPSIYPSSGDFYCENYRNSDHNGLKIFKEQDLGEDVP